MGTNMLPLSNETHVGILEEGRECVVAIDDLRDRLGVDALIRLHPEDFDQLSSHGSPEPVNDFETCFRSV